MLKPLPVTTIGDIARLGTVPRRLWSIARRAQQRVNGCAAKRLLCGRGLTHGRGWN
jgi:hypothetical protein